MGHRDVYGLLQSTGAITFEPTGIPVKSDLDITVDYTTTPGDFTVSVAPAVTSFDVLIRGKKYTKTTAQTVTVNSAATDDYYIYFNSLGVLTASTTFWDLSAVAPVCYVYYNATLQDGIGLDERHGISMDWATHTYLHLTVGTRLEYGGELTGYTLATDSNDANAWGMNAARIWDEDLTTTILAKTDPTVFTAGTQNYFVLYRSGASGDWTFTRSEVPFLYAAGSYFQYNEDTGATWQLTTGTANYFSKYFVFLVPALDEEHKIIIIPAQDEFATLDEADAYSFSNMSLGTDFPILEIEEIAEVVVEMKNANSSLGKVTTVSVERRLLSGAQILFDNVSTVSHNS